MTTPSPSAARAVRPQLTQLAVQLATASMTALLLLTMFAATVVGFPAAVSAHAELLEASPDRSSTVGGTFDQVALQFVGLAHPGEHEVLILDPLGNTIEILDFEQDFNRLLVSISPLTIEGEYIVSYQTDGIDNDLTTGSYTFTYDADADPPGGISHRQETPGVDWVTVGLIITTVVAFLAWLLYVIKRLRAPVPDADDENSGDADADGSVDRDQVGQEDKGLTGSDVGWDSVVTKRKVGRDHD